MPRHTATSIIEEIESASSPETFFRRIKDFRYSFFLDSSKAGRRLGRYSIAGCDPFLVFKAKRDSIVLEWEDGRIETFTANPFRALKTLLARYRLAPDARCLPLISGAVGYFSYDMKDHIERLPNTAIDDTGIPDCILGFYDSVLICDTIDGRSYVTSSGLPECEAARREKRARGRLEEFKEKVRRPERFQKPLLASRSPVSLRSNFSLPSYTKAIERAKEYIRRGDIYQVNLSQRFEGAGIPGDPFAIYARLRKVAPAPFSAYLEFGGVTLLSSSPERFLMKRGDYIETRPIKGTRPRGDDRAHDAMLERELLASAKDRAEHVMIVDLERNDLGRICEYGTVAPGEFIALEKYSTVFHLVSTVSGTLRKGVDAVDCLLAAFPGGSITGAPKIRAMEIIDELEPVRRSVYTGAIGYLSFDGDMDTSIVIRTSVVTGGRMYFQVGGGIVADSDPEGEYYETLDKAKGFMRALGIVDEKRQVVLV